MKLYRNFFFILLIIISQSASQNLDENNDESKVKRDQIFLPNHIITVVQKEMETNKTMTGALGQGGELAQGRTFGIKRLQFMLLPIMYKMGVMTTLLVTLVVLSLKSVLIGVILMIFKVGAFIAKLKSYPEVSQPAHSWSPPWPQVNPQPVHIHLHNSASDNYHYPHDYHGAYDRSDQQVLQYQIPTSGFAAASAGSVSSNPYENKPIGIDSYGQYIFRG